MATYVTFTKFNQVGGQHQEVYGQANWEPLLIGGNPIKFIHPSLLRHSEFHQCTHADNRLQWRLTFFKRSPHETSIDLHFFDAQPAPAPVSIGKSIWMQLDKQHSDVDFQSSRISASHWLRGSSTLDANVFEKDSDRYVAIDSKGIAFLSPTNQKDTFKRCLILQALAYAYHQVLADSSQQLTNELENVYSIREIYNKLIMFNAKFFLSYPVDFDGVALPLIWERIREKFNIERVNKELTRQAFDLSQILAEKAREDAALQYRDRANAERERARLLEVARQEAVQQDMNRTEAENKRSRTVQVWGRAVSACLAAVSILQVLQAPPSQLYDNLKLWRTLLF